MGDGEQKSNGGEIRVSREGPVTRLTFANPGKKNALGQAMYVALCDALDEAAAAPEVNVVVLQGADGIFTAGNDASDATRPAPGEKPGTLRFIETIAAFPKPLVAKVEGVAIGLGCTMLLHCDLVYAAEDSRFLLPFVNQAVVPEAGSTYLLPALMGNARAFELVMFGEMFSAQVAHQVGIVNQVLPAEELEAHVQKRVATLAAKPRAAVRRAKALLRAVPAGGVMGRIAEESDAIAACIAGPEFAEMLAAFREKRKPDYSKV
ncbi:MAG TPA: enoyl-CoA hydratase [Parvibaculum sp.]